MLKSTVSMNTTSQKMNATLPALYRTPQGTVVLFRKPTEGMVVGGDFYELGHYSETWVTCFDTTSWTRLEPGESITIAVE